MQDKMKKIKTRKAEGKSFNKPVVVGIAMVVCVALALGILLITGGGRKRGGGITAQTSGAAKPQAVTTSGTQQTLSLEEVEVPPLSVYRRRNPFEPLINMEETAPTAQTTPSAGGMGVVTVPPQLESPGRPLEDNVISKAVTLDGIYEQDGKMFANIRVADQLYSKLAVGDTFADNYKLLALGKDSSATILYGDERFTVFVGQSIYW